MKEKNLLVKIFSAIIALTLALAIGLELPASVAAESIPEYVKEVKMVTASSKDEAFAALQAAGYTPCDYNLRDGISGNVCYMGYKKTINKDEAITDIRLMNNSGGVNEKSFRDIKKSWKTGLTSSTQYFKEACLDVKANYEAGSPLAKAAVEILDVFDYEGTKLSEYLFSSDRTDADYEDILLICADDVVTSIYSALILGAADYGTKNFAERLGEVNAADYSYDIITASEGVEEYAVLWDKVSRIMNSLQDFGATYDEAVLYFQENQEELQEKYGSYADSSSEETEESGTEAETEYWKQFIDDYYKNSEDTEEQSLYNYAAAIGAYNKLKSYASFDTDNYGNLAEYIYACTAMTDDSTSEEELNKIVYSIYPLASVLTDSQLFALQYGGVTALVNTLDNNTDSRQAEITAITDEIKSKVQSNGVDTVSVFYNVNKDIYDKKVAFTDAATREDATTKSYEYLTKEEMDDQVTQNLTKVVFMCGIVAVSVLAVTVIALSITAFVAGTTMGTLLSVGFTAIMAGSISFALGGMTLTSGAVVMGIIGVASVVVVIILVAIIVICVLTLVIKKIIDANKDDEDEVPVPDIPQQIYDYEGSRYTIYDAVTDTSGNPVNFTCKDSAKEWDVMYVSKTSVAGNPIEVKDGNVFTYYTNVTEVPDDSQPVRRFGATDPANLNSFQSSPAHALYLGCNVSETAKQEDTGKKVYYVSDLLIASESTAEASRLNLVNKGFTPIEQNLTPYTSKVSYLGYKKTTNASDAVTDIRVAYYYTGTEFRFGTTNSGEAVTYTKFGSLDTQTSFFYSKKSSNGSPILPSFKITTSLLGADSGYEGVNLFSGGEAFNLVNGSDNFSGVRCLDDNLSDKLYLYFKPSETYSSSSTEYLSGFAFTMGDSSCLSMAQMCGFKVVPSLSSYNLTNGLTESPTYILYSTTHNPKRAITEIKTFEAGNKATGLYENLSSGSVGFAACETFAVCHISDFLGTKTHRLIRPSNAFITRQTYEGAVDTYLNQDLEAMNSLGYYDSVPMTGLYVAGPYEGKTPLKFDDVYFSTDMYDTDRTSFTNSSGQVVDCRPVNDFTDCYSTSAKNLTFEWKKLIKKITVQNVVSTYEYTEDFTFTNFLRMYYKGSVPVRGKYVKNVYVSSVEPDDDTENYSYDQAMAKLISYGEGEIKKVNFSRSRSSQPVTYSTYTDSNGKSVTRETVREYTGKSTYIMVTYTDTLIGSMRNIVTDWNSDDVNNKPDKIKYCGADFYSCKDAVFGQSGNYMFYSSSNGYFGSAITNIIADGNYLVNGCTTTRSIDGVVHTGEDFVLKMQFENNKIKAYVKNVCVSSQSSKEACLSDLYARGCTAYVDQEKNEGLGGKYIYIGYDTTNDVNDTDIITGIQCKAYSSKNYTQSYTDTDGSYYYRITGDMNDSRGGDYTYLFLTKSRVQNPIVALSTYYLMCLNKDDYIDYISNNWVTTSNLSSGTKNNTYLCYKQTSNDWKIENNVLTISTVGDMRDYLYYRGGTYRPIIHDGRNWYFSSETQSIFYPNPPEWTEYAVDITEVIVKSSCTKVDNCAFMDCKNIKRITFEGYDTQIDSNLFLGCNPTFVCYMGSGAYTWAKKNYRKVEVMNGTGTAMGTGSYAVIGGISGIMVLLAAAALVYKKKKKKFVPDLQEKETD